VIAKERERYFDEVEILSLPQHDLSLYLIQWLRDHGVSLSLSHSHAVSSSLSSSLSPSLSRLCSTGELDSLYLHLQRMIQAFSPSLDEIQRDRERETDRETISPSKDMLSFSPLKTQRENQNHNGTVSESERMKTLLQDISVSYSLLFLLYPS
jgi:hypothetical protein